MKRIRNEEGATGIGVMIILIAMILVAVIAAGMMLNVGNLIQLQADETSSDANVEASTKLDVVAIYGMVNASSTGRISTIYVKVELAPGSPTVWMNNTIIQISDGANREDLDFAGDEDDVGAGNPDADSDSYSGHDIRDPETLWSPVCFVGPGALIRLRIYVNQSLADDAGMEPQEDLILRIIPKHGHTTRVEVTMPDAFTGEVVDIY